jgi:hypothetical protein
MFLCASFLSLLLVFQQIQVHWKQISYASSITFLSLDVFTVSWRWEDLSLKSSKKNSCWGSVHRYIFNKIRSILIGIRKLSESLVFSTKLHLRGFWRNRPLRRSDRPIVGHHVGDLQMPLLHAFLAMGRWPAGWSGWSVWFGLGSALPVVLPVWFDGLFSPWQQFQ